MSLFCYNTQSASREADCVDPFSGISCYTTQMRASVPTEHNPKGLVPRERSTQ